SRPAGRAGRPPPARPASSRLALLDLRSATLGASDAERAALEDELRVAERELASLKDREKSASSARNAASHELRKVVRARVRGALSAGSRVRLDYRVDAARWVPSYVLRLREDLGEGELEMRGAVAQLTGEDWSHASVSLSTARLEGWAELPELTSIRIGRAQPPPARSWRAPPLGTDALFADYDAARPSRDTPVETIAILSANQMPAIEQAKGEASRRAAADVPAVHAPPPPPMSAPIPSAPSSYAAPPPAGAAPPSFAPQAPAPMRSRMSKKSAGLGAAIEGVARLAMDEPAEEQDAFGGAAAEEPAPSPTREALLEFGAMRMARPNDPDRGRPSLVPTDRRYAEELERIGLPASIPIESRARSASSAIEHVTLPPGCTAPALSGFDYTFVAEGRLSASSDGRFHTFSVARGSRAPRPRFVVVPRESRDAFRTIEMDNPLGAPLLLGPVDVYVGKDFLLTSQVREVPEDGSLALGLGIDGRLKVARNARFEERSGGMLGGRLDLVHDVEIEIASLMSVDAEVEVRERLPVTREDDDDIKVEEGRVEPPWSTYDPEDAPGLEGGRRWRITLGAGRTATLRASYTVRIAGKNELVGGNRREP
ncbi:MAG: DUF4139 domain-containing protein, partial [Sandaracinaceae bacterium]